MDRTRITIKSGTMTLPTTAASATGTRVEVDLTNALTSNLVTLNVALAADAVGDNAGIGIQAVAATSVVNALMAVPATVSATATAGDRQVTLQWATPHDNGSAILRYQVQQHHLSMGSLVSGPWTNIQGSNANTVTHTVTDLINGVTYAFDVRAVNSIGPGGSSTTQSVIPGTIPSAPRILTAQAGDRHVRLQWVAPASNGGNVITGYEYRQKAGTGSFGAWTNIAGSDAATTGHTVTGLINGTTYTFMVRAKNPMGKGPQSNQASATPVTLASAPQSFTATAGNGEVALRWAAPASDGGSAIRRYEYRVRAGGSSNWNPNWKAIPGGNANTTEYTVLGLTNGTAYTFEVRAETATGKGTAASQTATPMAAAPGAPRSLTVLARDQAVKLTWKAPVSDGASPILRHQYRQKQGPKPMATGRTSWTAPRARPTQPATP